MANNLVSISSDDIDKYIEKIVELNPGRSYAVLARKLMEKILPLLVNDEDLQRWLYPACFSAVHAWGMRKDERLLPRMILSKGDGIDGERYPIQLRFAGIGDKVSTLKAHIRATAFGARSNLALYGDIVDSCGPKRAHKYCEDEGITKEMIRNQIELASYISEGETSDEYEKEDFGREYSERDPDDWL
jgi:hypothetical protein